MYPVDYGQIIVVLCSELVAELVVEVSTWDERCTEIVGR